MSTNTVKIQNNSDTQNNCCNYAKNLVFFFFFYHKVMCLNDADKMANSVDPDQTAPVGAV